MTHYICSKCGAVFTPEEAIVHAFVTPTEVGGKTEGFLFCPECGSPRLEEAYKCRRCKGMYRYADLRGGYYCDQCMMEMQDPYHTKWFIREELDAFAEFMHEIRSKGGADDEADNEVTAD